MKIDNKNLKGKVFKFSYDTKKFDFKELFEEHFQKIKIKNTSISQNIKFDIGEYYLYM